MARTAVIDAEEAEVVSTIYRLYLEALYLTL